MILIQLYVVFLAVGTLAFGGGYAMLPFIKSLLVNNMHWITAAQFTSYIGICQIAPGPVSVNLTYFVGFKLAGVPGGILAMIGLCTTPFILVSIAFKAFSKFCCLECLFKRNETSVNRITFKRFGYGL